MGEWLLVVPYSEGEILIFITSSLSAFYHDKAIVIQEARVFNESPISPRKCRALLTRIVFLLYVGETFTTQEATTLFFGVTKLFQHKDVSPWPSTESKDTC